MRSPSVPEPVVPWSDGLVYEAALVSAGIVVDGDVALVVDPEAPIVWWLARLHATALRRSSGCVRSSEMRLRPATTSSSRLLDPARVPVE